MNLVVDNLATGYGETQVLFAVSMDIGPGEVVALLGRNGMGKTTTVRAIMGQLPHDPGAIRLDGQDLAGVPPYEVAQRGVGLVPEGRQIFSNLTVQENLVATATTGGPWNLPAIWRLFPRLEARRRVMGHLLSGGEQQMLAIGRALLTNPRLLILDEATEGLAPVIRAEIWSVLAGLKPKGLSILLIDKNISAVLRLADAAVIIEKGRTVWRGTSAELQASPTIRDIYLHV